MGPTTSVRLSADLSPVDHSILEKLTKLSQRIQKQGYQCRASSEAAIDTLLTLPEEKKNEILKRVRILNEIIVQADLARPDSIPASEHPERFLIQKALDFYGIEIDEDFWLQVQRDEIIEIYNHENIQIFRSFNFFKFCVYSLLDLLIHEWFVLWERPSAIIGQMMTAAQGCLSGERQGISKMNIPRHILKEIYQNKESMHLSRSCLIEFNVITATLKKETKEITGFIVSSQGQLLSFGAEADAVSFI